MSSPRPPSGGVNLPPKEGWNGPLEGSISLLICPLMGVEFASWRANYASYFTTFHPQIHGMKVVNLDVILRVSNFTHTPFTKRYKLIVQESEGVSPTISLKSINLGSFPLGKRGL